MGQTPETTVEACESPGARFGRSLAVVVGIDTYGEGVAPLRSAVADAKAIAEALHRDHGFETWCLFDAPLPRLLSILPHAIPIYGTLWALLLAYVALGTPVAVRVTSAAYQQIANDIEECSRVHGAGWWQTLLRILIALAWPSFAACWVAPTTRATR